MPSDIEVVSQWLYHNQDAGRVPYGTVFLDDDTVQGADEDGRTLESIGDVFAAVDWRGVDSEPGPVIKPELVVEKKRGPGRPKKVMTDG